MWFDLVGTIKKMGNKGILFTQIKNLKETNQPPTNVQPTLLNKIEEYCKGANKNITLPIEYNEVKILAILESGVEIAITTRKIWEAWEKLAIQKIRMKLQLADGHLELSLGLLEGVSITTCGIKLYTLFPWLDLERKLPIISS